jgi:hypothetical protein
MEILTFILITSLAICGLYLSSQPGMILHFITRNFEGQYLCPTDRDLMGNGYEKKVNRLKAIGMPIILCPTCMASVWGFTSYWFYFGHIDWMVIPCIFALAFTNSLLIELYDLIRQS